MDESSPQTFEQPCPVCLGLVQVAAANEGQIARCPHCGQEFTIAAGQIEEAQTDEQREQAEADKEEKISLLRIQQFSRMRRAGWRSWGYCIVAAGACAVAAAESIYYVIRGMRFHIGLLRCSLYLLLTVLFLWGAWYFLKWAMGYENQNAKPPPPENLPPPDFSTLSDGSQQAKNLENIR